MGTDETARGEVGRQLNPQGVDAETIRRGDELYRALAQQLPNVALLVFDREQRVLVAEGEALTSYGAATGNAEGRPLRDVMAPETYAGLAELYRAAIDGERSELEQASPDGNRVFRVFGKPLFEASGDVWAGMALAQDITDLRAHEKELRARAERLSYLAHNDELTGLANRVVFRDRLAHALARAERESNGLALLFVDLDRFKDINDTLGHAAGDQLLKAVARLLLSAVRSADTVARLGGDEFVILVEGIRNDAEAHAAVERLLEVLRPPLMIAGTEVRVSASAGVALSPRNGATSDGLIAAADRAMYMAKASGGNDYRFFDSGMQERALQRVEIHAALHHAFRRDEFVLHYQPAVDLDTGRVRSIEALIRWNHPKRGLLSPGEFIPIAEQNGFAEEITTWVLRQACRQARAWQDAGVSPLRVAINSCSRGLAGGLDAAITEALRVTGLSAERLEVEVTERFLGDDDAVRDGMLTQLKRMGISIALDDFGTGYSSLARLRSLPIDVIKIDRAFTADLPTSGAIADAIITLATNLNLRVIAEGVEHDYQRAWLKESGCEAASGYLFHKPQPAEELTPWLLALPNV